MEQAVRESLRTQVDQAPPLPDLADRVIADVRRSKTRRSWCAAAAGAACVIATVLSAGLLAIHPSEPSDPGTGTGARPADRSGLAGAVYAASAPAALVVDRSALALPDGRVVQLTGIPGGVDQAYQTQDGWLLLGRGSTPAGSGGQSLWLAKSDGSLLCLLSNLAGPVALGSDGRRLSWSTGDRLWSGRLDADGTIGFYGASPNPEGVLPETVVGDTVVLGRTTDGRREYDTWQPGRGGYAPTWRDSSHVRKVFGTGPNENGLIGLVPAGDAASQLCLARLDPGNTLTVTKTACAVPGLAGLTSTANPVAAGAVSPDGQRLAVRTDDHLTVLDLTTVFTTGTEPTRWNAAEPGVWVDSTTMIAPDSDGWLRSFRDQDPKGKPVQLPDGSGPAPAASTVPVGRLS